MTAITKLHFVEVSALKGGIIRNEKVFKRSELDVIGENPHALVVDDIFFTTIRKSKKDEFYTCLNRPSISVFASDRVWGSGVTYRMYSIHKVRAETIRAQIKAAIEKKIGILSQGIDLRFITDKTGDAA